MTESTNSTQLSQAVRGISFIQRIAQVNSQDPPFLACTLGALVGPPDRPEVIYYDAKVVGADTEHLVRKCFDAVMDRKDFVLVDHILLDPKINKFKYRAGPKKDTFGASLKVELHTLNWIKINGVRVWPPESTQNLPSDAAARLAIEVVDPRSKDNKSSNEQAPESPQFSTPKAA